jgi:hypothetical protein
MAVSEEREMAVRKEMAVMCEEGVMCEGMTAEAGMPESSMEGARVPSATAAVPSATAAVPSATAAKTATTTMHSHSGRTDAECRDGRYCDKRFA